MFWTLFPIFLVSALALVAVGFDLWSRRIPNWLTLLMAVGGVSAAMARPDLTVAGSLLGLCIGLLVPFVLFALGMLGAGDAKLLAAIGAWVGPIAIIWVLLLSAVAGGLLALVAALVQGQLRPVLRNTALVGMNLLMTRRTQWISATDAAREPQKRRMTLPYALAIAAGLVATQVLMAAQVIG